MPDLKVEIDPSEVGFDPDRLSRIDRHFARYVDDGRLPGWLICVSRNGRIAHVATYGSRDVEAGLPVETDTIFRIYSMTKPITSVALMMLYEEGAFELKDPVYRYIPSFRDVRVFSGGSSQRVTTVPATEPVRIWHLLTHTSGLTYGFHYSHPVDAMYRAAGFEWGSPQGQDLESACDTYASLPLLFQPGTEWNYSVSTDVVGRLVEVLSGQPLDRFFAERVFEPLGMTDTAFWVDAAGQDRLAALYLADPATRNAIPSGSFGDAIKRRPALLSGGGGLAGTASDYHRFTQMLLNGGALDGARLLSPRTVAFMASNHLPGGADLEAFGRPLFAETTFDGVGFGLGLSVSVDPVKGRVPGSAGEYGWGGAASTAFWVDPAERITVLFMTQLLPSSTHPIRPQLKQLVAQALVD
ncbi:MAG: beta-lactamase family protein [Actinobacteria bacterium]|nr:beta-lactamase family protein [Actinomycetota bacterium]